MAINKMITKSELSEETYVVLMENISKNNPALHKLLEYNFEYEDLKISENILEFLSVHSFEAENVEVSNSLLELIKGSAELLWFEIIYGYVGKEDFQEIADEIVETYKKGIPVEEVVDLYELGTYDEVVFETETAGSYKKYDAVSMENACKEALDKAYERFVQAVTINLPVSYQGGAFVPETNSGIESVTLN